MKILLIGEASNLHWTLAEGLRANGHTVTVVSHGSHWLNNKRDVSIVRRGYDLFHSIQYMADIIRHLPQMRGYDVVQACFYIIVVYGESIEEYLFVVLFQVFKNSPILFWT